jgi:hypothetical protein
VLIFTSFGGVMLVTGSKRGALPFDVPMLITLTDPQVQRG